MEEIDGDRWRKWRKWTEMMEKEDGDRGWMEGMMEIHHDD